jgi:hypothetical protein
MYVIPFSNMFYRMYIIGANEYEWFHNPRGERNVREKSFSKLLSRIENRL